MDKTSYALGMSIANNLQQSGVTRLEMDDFCAGLKAMMTGEKPALTIEEAGEALDAFFKEIYGVIGYQASVCLKEERDVEVKRVEI